MASNPSIGVELISCFVNGDFDGFSDSKELNIWVSNIIESKSNRDFDQEGFVEFMAYCNEVLMESCSEI